MSMNNLIEYCDSYSRTSGGFCNTVNIYQPKISHY